MSLKGLNLNLARRPLPAPRVIPNDSAEFARIVREETHAVDAEIAVTDAIIESTPGGVHVESTEENIANESEKLSRLVEDDFPFDESQLQAVGGLVLQQYGCLIGAAGTGKTTVTKKFVDMLRDGLGEVDVSQYWKRGQTAADEHDEYEIPERLIPSILMCSFTGRSTQMTKKNFPLDWHPNIMTIHRALGFYPEFYEDFDPESNQMVNKRRFVPSYTADNLMPWDIVIIDECGMLGLDLWHQLWAACKPGCRIYMIGDINQLPPTHGKSILGFALGSWPTWELTHVHRQQGANNSIVDNAHRVLKGLRPVSDSPVPLSMKPLPGVKGNAKMQPLMDALKFMTQDKDWRFLTVEVEDEHAVAAGWIRQALRLLHNKLYDPNRDVVITPINGFEQTAPGYTLGQQPMNQNLVNLLNPDSPRYIIDAGREKVNFAVGDKVMATVNDYEQGVTNGMTGIVRSITEHGGYMGDMRRFGLISEVNEYFDSIEDDDPDEEEFSLDEMVEDSAAGMDELKKREKGARGPASHIIDVEFGEGDHAFTISFSTQSQVGSLMLAYVATCHKMQGGECPLVFVICHQSNKRPLTREWLYTAITRASQRCVIFYTRQGMGFAVSKQTIKGQTLQAKIKSFQVLTESGLVGPSVRVKLPPAASLVTDMAIANQPTGITSEKAEPEARSAPEQDVPQRPTPQIKVGSLHIHIYQAGEKDSPPRETVRDGGTIVAENPAPAVPVASLGRPVPVSLPAPAKLVSQTGAVKMALQLSLLTDNAQRLLTHTPAPKPVSKLAGILAKQALTKHTK